MKATSASCRSAWKRSRKRRSAGRNQIKQTATQAELWPALSYSEWQPTLDTLHMWTQMVGKTRLELTPLVNHWWNTALHVSARGLCSRPISFRDIVFDMEFDFLRHRLVMRTNDGREKMLELAPRSVADFYKEYMACLRSLGIEAK